MQINVIGLGYVGLPTALLLATSNCNVLGVEINANLIKQLSTKNFNSEEAMIDEMLEEAINSDKISFSETPRPADFHIICVPTPCDVKNKPDLSFVLSAIDAILDVLSPSDTIIIESTIPVGTTEAMKEYVISKKPDLYGVGFAHCPERVLPGNAVNEIIYNHRIIGGLDSVTTSRVENLYKLFTKGIIEKTDAKTAEIVKLSENTFRDVNIALANELNFICIKNNINYQEVRKLANMHPRVNLHQSGIGVGGHCIPVDPYFLTFDRNDQFNIIAEARKANIYKETIVEQSIKDHLCKTECTNVSFFGLTYKPDTSDFRESPALRISLKIIDAFPNITFSLIDPYISNLNLAFPANTIITKAPAKNSDINFLLVKHSQFESYPESYIDLTKV